MGNILIKKHPVPIKPINLGNGQSFDIKTLFPKDYQKFTSGNFFVNSAGSPSTSGRVTGTSSGVNMGLSVRLVKSYNSSTGILSCYYIIDGENSGSSRANVNAVLIPNLTKAIEKGYIVYLGSGRSFNISTIFPNDYTKMTNANFFISSTETAAKGNKYYGGTFSCIGYGQLVLGYNASTGALSTGNNLIVTNDGGGYITSQYRTCYVYASKKPME